MTQIYTLIWLIIAPVVPGGVAKDQSVVFSNKVTRDECYAMKSRLDEFTTATPDVIESHVICVPVPR